jgi:hypothetical protein
MAAWRANPFFVLELKTDATRADVERAGQRLLAKFGIDSAGIAEYDTPFGKGVRDADMVRQSLAALRDPVQRVTHELWANISALRAPESETNHGPIWEHAERAMGWAEQ